MPARVWSNRNSHSLVVMQNDIITLKDSLTISYTDKHSIMIQFSSHVPRYYLTDIKLMPSLKPAIDVYRSFIDNYSKQ